MTRQLANNPGPRCVHCGDVIGAYEPFILAQNGTVRQTSRAAEPTLIAAPGEHYHRDCYGEGALEQAER